MSPRRLIVIGLLATAALPVSTSPAGAAHRHGPRVQVSPPTGSPSTRFVVSFRAPDRTGRDGSVERSYVISAAGPRGGSNGGGDCIGSVSVSPPASSKGARVRVTLGPAAVGAGLVSARPPRAWCAGTYHGEIEEVETPVCSEDGLCPAFVVLRGIIGRFSFVVNAPGGGDTAPPTFAGIQRAFACTPGPQRPGQTTPYHLSWQAASDGVTASSEIVYDVYSSSTRGGEDFSRPTWITPPGVTSFVTPGLASHGSSYFVVRARDRAGNEDRNRIEMHGVDPCY